MRIKDIIDFIARIDKKIEQYNCEILINVRMNRDELNKEIAKKIDKLYMEKDVILFEFNLEGNKELMDKVDYIKWELL